MNALADMSPTARKAVFGVVAVLLAVLAFFAAKGPGDSSDTPKAGDVTASSSDVVVVPEQDDAAAPEAGASDAPTGAAVDLPLTPQALADTKALATRFVTEYTTYKYNQDDEQVINRLASMLDKDPTLSLDGVIPTGTFKAGLVKDRYSTTATATVSSVSTISKNLVAYVVTADVTTRRAGSSTTANTTYLVTLTREAGWGINNVELADKDASQGGMD